MKFILFILAWPCLLMGIIGAFLPIIPTTPFILLALFLFSKSSPRFHQWLLNLPLAGSAVKDWQLHRIIRPRAKILCGAMILSSLILIWARPEIMMIVKMVVSLLLVSVGLFVMTRKSSLSQKLSE